MKVPIRKSVTELVIYGKVQIDFILEAIETLNANSSKTSGWQICQAETYPMWLTNSSIKQL